MFFEATETHSNHWALEKYHKKANWFLKEMYFDS